ncbi:flavin reductase family protein [Nocardia sp. NBC_01388]|uniref:flavin reductase family protein n=1 Tax=Nocardia sp. NBC_01388 TaxID=2903596 RepID=UPI0032504A3F
MTAQQSAAFDAFVTALDNSLVVVTTRVGAQRTGCLVGFAAQVSIEPRRFMVGISKQNHTYRIAMRAGHLAVHLLDERQLPLATLFGSETGDEIDKFTHCEWHPGPANLPILDAAAGWFCGRIVERHDVGDHIAMLLAPEGAAAPAKPVRPLRYRAVADLPPGHPA